MTQQANTITDMLAQRFGSIPDLIRAQADWRPGHPALIQDGQKLSYRELDTMMDQVACALQRDHVQVGDAIGICATASLDYAVLFMGVLRAGMVVVPLAPSTTAEGLAAMMQDAQVKMLFVDAAAVATLAPVRERIAALTVALDGSGSELAFKQWLGAPGCTPEAVACAPHWAFNLIYSSGTTGAPKGIIQPHVMRWEHVQRGIGIGYGPDAVTLLSTPLYSNTTLVSFFATLSLGGSVLLMAKFDAAAYLALAQQYRVTHTMLVPVQYQRLLAMPDFDSYDLSSFIAKFCTSAPFSAALKTDVLKRWPGRLTELYGMTEGGGTCILMAHEHPDKLHTVGRPGLGSTFHLIDDDGNLVAPGASGEIVGRSDSMMSGYHNQRAKTTEAEWHDADGLRYIRTGDIGRFDSDGFLVLGDRKKDMLISGGLNIYPSDLEAVLQQHAAVVEVAVIGVPSKTWGETPLAFVVLRAASALPAKELLEWANARLGKMQRLCAVQFVDTLPRSAIGKVLKRELRNLHEDNSDLAA
jgi:long-chain acyl-CoA synthetase